MNGAAQTKHAIRKNAAKSISFRGYRLTMWRSVKRAPQNGQQEETT